MSPVVLLQGPTVRALIKSYLLVGLVVIATVIALITIRVTREVAVRDRLTTRFIAHFAAPTLLTPQQGLAPQQERDLRASLAAIKDVTFPFVLTDLAGRPHFWNAAQIGVPLPDRYADLLSQDPDNPSDPRVRRVVEMVRRFDEQRQPIAVLAPGEDREIGWLHYGESSLSRRLAWMPWMEAALIVAFMGVALMAFRNMKRSEQRSIWVGMAKETAHQMGTPLTSINGWLALLREQDAAHATARSTAGPGVVPADPTLDRAAVLGELQRDLERLAKVSERFNQIGSRPRMAPARVDEIVGRVCAYFRRRLPQLGRPVRLESQLGEVAPTPLNAELLEWVCENLIKNALDAIDKTPGVVEVTCRQLRDARRIEIVVKDNGKGMSPAVQRRIFEPGFTTKQGGWGMGMVLVRRIVEEYHGGRVEVAKSTPGEGSTLRVTLPMR